MYRKYLVFGAGVFTIFIFCSTAIAMCVVSNSSIIPDVWIGEVIVEWDSSVLGRGWPKCYLENGFINISTNDDNVEICVGLNCSMFFRREMWFPRIAVYELILHLDNLYGKIIGRGNLTLCGRDGEDSGVVIACEEFESYKNETRYIWCEVTTIPYIELFGISLFTFKWGSPVTCSCSIECKITHTD